MTTVFKVRNVSEAMATVIPWLLENGTLEASRNGSVIVAPSPVVTEYTRPWECVVFSEERDANPFFHLMEALWMLAGKNDLKTLEFYNSKFGAFSDDDETIHGAYGYRWRNWFFFDQLQEIIQLLKKDPTTRRAVLTMWSPEGDLVPHQLRAHAYGIAGQGGLNSKDVPCNTHAYFDLRGGVLNMTVCNRSNDLVWGAYGANAVHFAVLQEYIAAHVGVEIGVYRQFSNNLHVYPSVYTKEKLLCMAAQSKLDANIYDNVAHVPLIKYEDNWSADLVRFFTPAGELHTDIVGVPYNERFFGEVAVPMRDAFMLRKTGASKDAVMTVLSAMPFCSWKLAAKNWVARRGEVKNAG